MTKERAELLLQQAYWICAKSMPQYPHEYTLRTNWKDEDFNGVVKFIRENGAPGTFFKQTYIYYYLDKYKYWTMGAPIEETKLINRARI